MKSVSCATEADFFAATGGFAGCFAKIYVLSQARVRGGDARNIPIGGDLPVTQRQAVVQGVPAYEISARRRRAVWLLVFERDHDV
ncbi:MAG: hypothetical protein ACOVNS_01780, partial [Erythrobacter sp.]